MNIQAIRSELITRLRQRFIGRGFSEEMAQEAAESVADVLCDQIAILEPALRQLVEDVLRETLPRIRETGAVRGTVQVGYHTYQVQAEIVPETVHHTLE